MQFLQWGLKMRKGHEKIFLCCCMICNQCNFCNGALKWEKGLEKSFYVVAWFATKQKNTQSERPKKEWCLAKPK